MHLKAWSHHGRMPTYCRQNQGRVYCVVVFNLTRFARDKYDHLELRSLLQSIGPRSTPVDLTGIVPS